jgi:hypothetical protein
MVSRSVDVKKIVLLELAAVVLILGNLGIVLVRHWPFSRERVTQSSQSTFPASVTFQKFHSTYLPHPGCIAEGVAFNRLGATLGTPPVVSIQRLVVRAHYLDLIEALRERSQRRTSLKGYCNISIRRGASTFPTS